MIFAEAGDTAFVLAAAIPAVCALVGVVVTVVVGQRTRAVATSARDEAAAANRAVNHRPEGDPTAYELLADIRSTQLEHGDRLTWLEQAHARAHPVRRFLRRWT